MERLQIWRETARELYGAMLLDRGMAKEALTAYEAVLKKEPNRLATYVGAAKSAAKVGNSERAKRYLAKIASLIKDADTERADIVELRGGKTASAVPVR